jgi:PTS system galactitol-specific IIA component
MTDNPNVEIGHLWCDQNLVVFFDDPVTRKRVIKTLSDKLHKAGFVRASYAKAVLDREEIFPTGLPTRPFGIAIPHTDSEHVEAGAIAVGILQHPTQFREMGGAENQWIDAHIVMALAIVDPGSVSSILRSLAMAFQDPDFLSGLKGSSSAETVIQLMNDRFPDVLGIS